MCRRTDRSRGRCGRAAAARRSPRQPPRRNHAQDSRRGTDRRRSRHDGPSTRTLTFTSIQKQRDFAAIDVKPKGDSIGDRYVFAATLRAAGKRAGRVAVDCVAADRTYQGLACVGNVILADGRITFQGLSEDRRIPGVGGTHDDYTITGGSGAYADATGTMRRSGNGSKDTLTFTLAG
jgi:hypothetical protein